MQIEHNDHKISSICMKCIRGGMQTRT